MNLAPSQAEKKYISVMKVSLDYSIIYYSLPNSFNIKEGKSRKTWKHIHKMKLLMKVRLFPDSWRFSLLDLQQKSDFEAKWFPERLDKVPKKSLFTPMLSSISTDKATKHSQKAA